MDPLSVTASIIAVLQATSTVISICYDFRAAIKNAPRVLTSILDEAKDLRSVLETLETLVHKANGPETWTLQHRPVFELICKPDEGPLAACLEELTKLESLLAISQQGARPVSIRRAFLSSLGWTLKESDAKLCLRRIERCKSTLNLAITADDATIAKKILEMTIYLDTTAHGINENVKDLLKNQGSRYDNERKQDLLRWLSPLHPVETHDSIAQGHQDGTSEWFLESEDFHDWLSASQSCLWVSAFPGAGKTMLFSSIVSYLTGPRSSTMASHHVAYMYCDFRQSVSYTATNIVGSLVGQLYASLDWFPHDLEREFDHSDTAGQKRRPSFAVLKEALVTVSRRQKICLLIDALDECNESAKILELVLNLQEMLESFSILITSRDEADIRTSLKGFAHVRLEQRKAEMSRDISAYLDYRLQVDSRLQWIRPAIKADIAHSLGMQSTGMFRWVQCQLDEIGSVRTTKAIKAILQELPQGLNQTYERVLKKISKHEIDIVRKVLLWTSFSDLPMTLEELNEALTIEIGSNRLDEDSRLSSPNDLVDLCGNLVMASDQNTITLAHLSVRDYLLSSEIRQNGDVSAFAMNEEEANEELAMYCLTYLDLHSLGSGPCVTHEDYAERIARHPLLKYASVTWAYYVRASGGTQELRSRMWYLFSPQRRAKFMSWVQVLNADWDDEWNSYPSHATPLYYAASFGLAEMVDLLIKDGADVNAPGGRFHGRPLHTAIMRLHIPIVKMLLKAGANPNQPGTEEVTPLHMAAAVGNIEMITLLLRCGALKTLDDCEAEMPHVWALRAGHLAAHELLFVPDFEPFEQSVEACKRPQSQRPCRSRSREFRPKHVE